MLSYVSKFTITQLLPFEFTVYITMFAFYHLRSYFFYENVAYEVAYAFPS